MKKISFIIFFVFQCVLISCKNEKGTTLDQEKNREISNKTIESELHLEEKNTEINNETLETGLQLEGKNYEELRLLRNEIYARKGYVFKDSTLNAYFSSQDWYTPNKEAEIILSDTEKQQIEAIKEAETKLNPFKLEAGHEIMETVSIDFDKDNVPDSIQLVKNTKSGNFEKDIYIYFSKNKIRQKITLIYGEGSEYVHPYLELENGLVQIDVLSEGSGHFTYGYTLAYNSKIENLQLISYRLSHKIMFGDIYKTYDLTTGIYEIKQIKYPIYDPDNPITSINEGKQDTKIITPDLITENFNKYLKAIGNEYEERESFDYLETDDLGEDITDCREEIIRRLQLEFEYGKLSYLGRYKIFKKELTDFVQSIDVNELLQSEDNSYSKNYHLQRNLNLENIEDDCEDEVFLVFDIKNNQFRIQISDCSIYRTEDGENTETIEGSYMFEFQIGKNCTFAFNKIIEVG